MPTCAIASPSRTHNFRVPTAPGELPTETLKSVNCSIAPWTPFRSPEVSYFLVRPWSGSACAGAPPVIRVLVGLPSEVGRPTRLGAD